MINERLSKHYDFFVDALFVGRQLQKKSLAFLDLEGSSSFLDVGCGTGTLALLAKQQHPALEVNAVDPGESVIGVAREKAAKSKTVVNFSVCGAEELPFEDKSMDTITSSLAFHHMPTEIKRRALSEIHRVLKDDGQFLLVDIGKPKNAFWKAICGLESLVEPREYIRDNLTGGIPDLIEESGFSFKKAREPYIGIHFWLCTK